jgi:PAS domain S-box-containing protein
MIERERDEAEIGHSGARYQVLFETMVQGVVYQDAEGKITSANPAAEKILGLSLDQMQGRTSTDPRWKAIHEDGSDFSGETHPSMVALATGKEVRDVVMGVFVPQAQDYHWININAVPLFRSGEDNPYRVYTTFEDITARRHAEEALRQSEDRFRALVQNGSDIVAVLNADGTIRYESPSIMRLLGYPPEDLIGRNAFDYIHPEDLKRAQDIFLEITKRSGASGPVEVRFRHADGSWRYLEGIANNLLDNPSVRGIVVNSRDVTKRKQAEQKLREVREEERSRLARDLHDEALQDLTYALAEVQFVQSVSKDPELGARLERAASALMQAGQGLHGAIHNLRLSRGRKQTFVELLEWIVELDRQSLPEREIELSVDKGSLPPLVKETEVELLRIVREALVNARRHSKARYVRIGVGATEGKLWAEVSDDGRGFNLAEVNRGVGIVGMRERAASVGGELDIRSEPGQGTKVRFELALDKDRQEQEEIRILLVEDHVSLREAVAALFNREPDFVVVGQVGSLSEARTMLDGVDVAIVDLDLPDGYGGVLIKELRDANPHAIALVLSAYSDRANIAHAIEFGAAGVLHKSVGINEIIEAVRHLRAGETLMPLEEVVEMLRYASFRRQQEHEARQAIAKLTSREREVLEALADGLDGNEIAERLTISLATERNHMASILAKLQVHSRLHALVFALRYGVVEIS